MHAPELLLGAQALPEQARLVDIASDGHVRSWRRGGFGSGCTPFTLRPAAVDFGGVEGVGAIRRRAVVRRTARLAGWAADSGSPQGRFDEQRLARKAV